MNCHVLIEGRKVSQCVCIGVSKYELMQGDTGKPVGEVYLDLDHRSGNCLPTASIEL